MYDNFLMWCVVSDSAHDKRLRLLVWHLIINIRAGECGREYHAFCKFRLNKYDGARFVCASWVFVFIFYFTYLIEN